MHMRVALVFVLLFFFAVDVNWGLAHYRADDLSGRNYELAIEVRRAFAPMPISETPLRSQIPTQPHPNAGTRLPARRRRRAHPALGLVQHL